MGESEDFNAKACDVSKTDVGLCSGNGPWVALLSLFSVRRGKKDGRMKEIAGAEERRQVTVEAKGAAHSTKLPSHVGA